MCLDAELIELRLVALTRLRRIVRDEQDGLSLSDSCDQCIREYDHRLYAHTKLPQVREDLRCTWDQASALPKYSIAVEQPGVVLVNESLVVSIS